MSLSNGRCGRRIGRQIVVVAVSIVVVADVVVVVLDIVVVLVVVIVGSRCGRCFCCGHRTRVVVLVIVLDVVVVNKASKLLSTFYFVF